MKTISFILITTLFDGIGQIRIKDEWFVVILIGLFLLVCYFGETGSRMYNRQNENKKAKYHRKRRR